MKIHTLLLLGLAACGVFAACEEEEGGHRSTESKLYINGRDYVGTNKAKVYSERLTVDEILAFDTLVFRGHKIADDVKDWLEREQCTGVCTKANGLIDAANRRLVREAGEVDFFDEYHDWVITTLYEGSDGHIVQDTLAYIPNDTVLAAYARIYELREQNKWDEIYEIFQDAFVFYPCTGEEYKVLEAMGLN